MVARYFLSFSLHPIQQLTKIKVLASIVFIFYAECLITYFQKQGFQIVFANLHIIKKIIH